MHRILNLIAASLLLPPIAHAQSGTSIRVGESVRVSASGLGIRNRTGTVVSIEKERLLLRIGRVDTVTLTVPFEYLERAEMRPVDAGRRTAKSAAIGGVVGLVGVGLAGYAITSRKGTNEYTRGWGVLLAPPGAAVGALIAGIAQHHSGENRWRSVDLPLRAALDVRKFNLAPTMVVPLGGSSRTPGWGIAASFRF